MPAQGVWASSLLSLTLPSYSQTVTCEPTYGRGNSSAPVPTMWESTKNSHLQPPPCGSPNTHRKGRPTLPSAVWEHTRHCLCTPCGNPSIARVIPPDPLAMQESSHHQIKQSSSLSKCGSLPNTTCLDPMGPVPLHGQTILPLARARPRGNLPNTASSCPARAPHL